MRFFIKQFEPLTEHEAAIGWPDPLCGGTLETNDFALWGVPGVVVGGEGANESELSGDLFAALARYFGGVVGSDGDRQLERLWNGPFDLGSGAFPTSGSDSVSGALVRARHTGRPRGKARSCPMDRQPYTEDPERYRAAVRAQCLRELSVGFPFIDVPALRAFVEHLCDAEKYPDPWAAIEAYEGPVNFTRAMDAAFLRSAPRGISRRGAVIRVVEYFWFKSGGAQELQDSRLFALASIAAGEDIDPKVKPWTVAQAIWVEQKAITHVMKLEAAWRTAFRTQEVEPSDVGEGPEHVISLELRPSSREAASRLRNLRRASGRSEG